MKSASLVAFLLLSASGASAGIVSVNLVDVSAASYDFHTAEITLPTGTGYKLYGTAESNEWSFGWHRLWMDLSVLNGTTDPWVSLTWDFTITRTSDTGDPADRAFWFGVVDFNDNLLALQSVEEGVEMSGEFWIPYLPEMNEAEVRLYWWGTESFTLDIPNNSIDFTPGAPTTVPEPGSLGLALAALGGVAAWTRRNRTR